MQPFNCFSCLQFYLIQFPQQPFIEHLLYGGKCFGVKVHVLVGRQVLGNHITCQVEVKNKIIGKAQRGTAWRRMHHFRVHFWEIMWGVRTVVWEAILQEWTGRAEPTLRSWMLSSSCSSDFFSIVSLQEAWEQFTVAEHFSHATDFTYAISGVLTRTYLGCCCLTMTSILHIS